MKEIKFSVLIPVYNAAPFLASCIDSVLSQRYKNFEIILVNDGSADESGNICDRYQKLYPDKIKVLHQENKGQIMSRNAAARLASGDFLVFLDSDDFLSDDALFSLWETIGQSGADLIIYKITKTDAKGESFHPAAAEFPHGRLDKQAFFNKLVNHPSLNSLCRKSCRRNLFDAEADYSAFKNIRNGEDLLQTLPLIEKAEEIFFLDKALYFYRINPLSTTRSFSSGHYRDLHSTRIAFWEYLEKSPYLNKTMRQNFFSFYGFIISNYLVALLRSEKNQEKLFDAFREIAGYTLTKQLPAEISVWQYSKLKLFILRLFLKKRYSLLFTLGKIEKFFAK